MGVASSALASAPLESSSSGVTKGLVKNPKIESTMKAELRVYQRRKILRASLFASGSVKHQVVLHIQKKRKAFADDPGSAYHECVPKIIILDHHAIYR